MQAKLDGIEEFRGIQGYGARLLQISRSTPYLSAALIGHKRVRRLLCSSMLDWAMGLSAVRLRDSVPQNRCQISETICRVLIQASSLSGYPVVLHTSSVAVMWVMVLTCALQAGHVLQNLELTSQNPISNESFFRVASLLRQATAAV